MPCGDVVSGEAIKGRVTSVKTHGKQGLMYKCTIELQALVTPQEYARVSGVVSLGVEYALSIPLEPHDPT